MYLQLHKVCRATFTDRHEETVATLLDRVNYDLWNERVSETVDYLETLLAEQQLSLGPNDLYTFVTRRAAGIAVYKIDRSRGLARLESCLQDEEKELGENHPGTLTTLTVLAALYHQVGDYCERLLSLHPMPAITDDDTLMCFGMLVRAETQRSLKSGGRFDSMRPGSYIMYEDDID